jgi:Tfp pilus tip-associated adhesin PilY1
MKKAISSFLFFLFVLPIFAYGDMDDIFQVKTPNVMIIFDTSNSMDNQPSGYSQAAGYMCLKNDGSGNFLPTDAKGNCSAGYTKYNFESGGNHPNSKLYQAKQSLKSIIDTVVKDQVNLGISTYAQSKTEIRRGYYQRDRRDYTAATADQWKWTKLYWRFNNYRHGPYSTISLSNNSFTDAWGILRTNVIVGTTFTRPHTFDNSPSNNHASVPPPHPPGSYLGDLKYTVTTIVYNAENNWYTFTYQDDLHDHYEETTRTLTFANNNAISCDAQFAKTWTTYKTYDSKDAVQISNPAKWACVGPTLVPGSAGGFGSWYKEYAWIQFSATACPATSGSDNLPANATQTTKYSYVGSCYDYSSYSYPADGSTNKPHTWGYYKVSGGTWKNSAQSPNYYPSKDGSGNFNMTPGTYDDHFFFLNFPDDKDVNFKESTRTTIMNKVDSFLDLTPVQSPETLRYWTKLPVQNTVGKIGLTSNTVASNYTPLADSLAAANRYFNDYIYNYNGGDPSSLEKFGETLCRGNYVILLTDGLESCRMNGGAPDYNAAPAEAANLLAINVKTFVIGFGSDLSGNLTLNNIAGSGGTGKAYFATNMAELQGALQSIFGSITGQYYGRSNPVITRARDRLFRGDFDIQDGQWRGHLTAWNADTQTGVLAPTFVWDAGEVMKSKRGKVYTWTGASPNPSIIEFQDDSSLYSLVNPFAQDINEDTKVDSVDAKTVINFTLDPNYNDGTHGAGYYKGKRAADWKLGDIYHSTPVVIAEPAFYFSESGYADFYNANRNREMIIYVGTNDGMLHGFKNSDGSEKFAVIPRNLLGNLTNLKSTHQIYVDSSPKAYDVYFKSGSKWKTVIVTGERAGGSYYFALDATNPDDPRILWEWTDASLGNTWAKPDVGKVLVGGQTKYVAFLTGGYSTTDNIGNTFYIVDIEDGSLLKSFTVGDSTNKIPAGPTAFDADQDGYIDSVYFGDTAGTIWKVDVTDNQTKNWALYSFFTPVVSKRRPIFYSPAVVKNDLGKTLVYIGSGNELNLMNPSSTDFFYEIEDQGTTGKQNWRKDLQTGEKVLASPSVANWVVYFTSWLYKADGQFCGAGEGRLWGLKVSSSTQTGGTAGLVTLDTATGKWKDPVEYISLGVGIPSAPVVTNGMVYVSTSLNANKVIQIPIPPWAKAKLKSWREVTK